MLYITAILLCKKHDGYIAWKVLTKQ